MIPVEELLYEFNMSLNKVATNKHQSIPKEDQVIFLNKAQINLINKKINPNDQGLGLDSFKKRYEDLESLIESHKILKVSIDKVSKLDKFNSDLTLLDPKYMFYIDSYFLCTKGECKDRIVTTSKIKHADIHTVLVNSNTNPSFEYQECPVTISNHILEFYTDGSFVPSNAYVSYLRYPKKIDFEGYIDLDGSPSITQDCELNYYLKDELVNLAVLAAALDTENQGAMQGAQIKLQNNE
jgi:hypothetical protein